MSLRHTRQRIDIGESSATTRVQYEHVFVWRKDLKRLRDLEYHWARSRVKVIEALLDMIPQPWPEVKPIRLDREVWARLEDAAARLRLEDVDALIRAVLGLVSQCTPAELLQFMDDHTAADTAAEDTE